MRYFVYMLRCSDGTYYIGKTLDTVKRLRQHNGEISGGAKYTRSRRPVVLIYKEEFDTLKLALVREIAIKKLTRVQKSKLLELSNKT